MLLIGVLGVVFGISSVSNSFLKTHSDSTTWEHNSRYHWQKVEGSNAVINKGEHEYGELITVKLPTEISYGTSKHVCGICGFEEFVRINKLEHTHTFSEAYIYDEEGHYHPATCEHKDVKNGYEAHDFHMEIIKTPTDVVGGFVKYVCNVCGYSVEMSFEPDSVEYSDSFESTEWGHYHPCVTPGYEHLKGQYTEHRYGPIEITSPTETENGYSNRACLDCGYIDTMILYPFNHFHLFSEDWSHNENKHWHSSTCEHDVKADYYSHDFIKINSNSDEYEQFRCQTCGYVKTKMLNNEHHYSENYSFTPTTHYHACTDEGFYDLKTDEGEHDFTDFIIYDLSTCSHNGKKFHECRICGYVESIDMAYSDHTYSNKFTSDETNHWFAATCEHSDEKKDVEPHSFYSTLITNPTFEQEGKMKYTCSVCEYFYYAPIPVKEHNYSTDWSFSNTTHFHKCTDTGYSGLKIDEEPHVYSGETFDVPEDGINNGEKYELCQICGYKHVLEVHYTLANECLAYMKFTSITGGYEVSKGTLSTDKTKIIIPDTYNNKPVIAVANSGFSGFSNLKEVILSSNLTKLNNSAFYGCKALTTITLPNTLTNIGQSVFSNCTSLETITIPSNVNIIYNQAFSGCSKLNTIVFKNVTMTFGNQVFNNCKSITNVYYDGTVSDWLGLSFGTYGQSNPLLIPGEIGKVKMYLKDNKGNVIKDGTNYSLLTGFNLSASLTINQYAFTYYNFTDPVTINGAVTIPALAFYYNSFSSLSLSNIITTLNRPFSNSTVENLNITLFDGVTVNGLGFYSTNLTTINLYSNSDVTVLSSSFAEGYSKLKTVALPNNIKTISAGAFKNCVELTTINKPTSLTAVEHDAFYGCSKLTNANEFASVSSLGEYAFYNGNVSNVVINNSVTVIPEYCFYNNTNLTSVTFPSGLLEIGSNAFNLCSSIQSINLPSKLTTIGDRAFYKCSGFTSLSIPKSVTYIGTSAFQYCTSLTYLSFSPTNYTCSSNIFWETKIDTIDVTSGVSVLRKYIFYRATTAKTCNLPISVKTIETQAFGSSNTRIYYAGTLAQWDAVSKDPSYEWGVQCYVTCSNGSTYTNL